MELGYKELQPLDLHLQQTPHSHMLICVVFFGYSFLFFYYLSSIGNKEIGRQGVAAIAQELALNYSLISIGFSGMPHITFKRLNMFSIEDVPEFNHFTSLNRVYMQKPVRISPFPTLY